VGHRVLSISETNNSENERRVKARILATVFSLVIANLSAQAAGLVNGNFEAPAINTSGLNFASAPSGFGWTILPSTSIDIIGSYWQPSSGQQSIDLSGWGPGVIYQDFTFPSAGTWAVNFDMSVNPVAGGNRSVGVGFGLTSGSLSSVGSFVLNSAGRTLANMNWVDQTTATFTVDASSSYRLQFTALDGDASGVALDNITLVQVPEPGVASIALVGAAILFGRFGKKVQKA
jgi:hypothetical protein